MINFFKRSLPEKSTQATSSEGDQLAQGSGFVALGAASLLATAAEVLDMPDSPRSEQVMLEGTAWLPSD
jgi:hypothetical protein